MRDPYLSTVKNVYKEAAAVPQKGLCCTTTPVWQLPGLNITEKMLEMNYGCGSTVHPRDLVNNPSVLYVGVGGGMELLQFSYFSRHQNGVVGVDIVEDMLEAAEQNLINAEKSNDWFKKDFVDLKIGDALHLPVEDSSIDVAAQNCLFNVFEEEDLLKALGEMYRVLKPGGKLVLSDPICENDIPDHLKTNEELRALCLSGALPLNKYLNMISDIGFGTMEVRAKRPYRILSEQKYKLEKDIYIESVEICAIKDPIAEDGPCVFTGRTAIYFGREEYFDDNAGHVLVQNQPLAVCDKTAENLNSLGRKDIFISDPTFFYDGGGCC